MKLTRTAAFYHRVLEAWPEESAGEIAAREGCTRAVVLSIVRRARLKGDHRAVSKPEGSFTRKPGWFRSDCPKTRAIWQSGVAARRRKHEEARA